MERLQFSFTILLQQHRNKAPLKHYQFTEKFNYTDLQDKPTFTVKYLICRIYRYFKLASRYLRLGLFCCHDGKNACFRCSCLYLELCSEDLTFYFCCGGGEPCQSSAHFTKLTCSQSPRQRPRVYVFAYSCSMSVVKNKKIEPATLLRVTA